MTHPLYDQPTWTAADNPEDMYHHEGAVPCDASRKVPDLGLCMCTLVKDHASPDHLSYDSQGKLRAGWPT